MNITLIAAVAHDGVIGDGTQLLWKLPEDMGFFKRATTGHVVIMGRKTWDSVPPRFRPLPGRRNIVVTRDAAWAAEGAEAAGSLQAALGLCTDADEVFVIGGGQLYALALPVAQQLLLTEIDHAFDGNVRFPEWRREEFDEQWRTRHDSPHGWSYERALYQRRSAR